MLTTECLESQGPHLDGWRRFYKLPNGYGLSVVNSPILHSYRFAWEIAVMLPHDNGLAYDTPLTDDVEVFHDDDEANEFIAKAIAWARETPA